jgi:hypothetical protein
MADPITNILKMLFGNLTKTGVDYGGDAGPDMSQPALKTPSWSPS